MRILLIEDNSDHRELMRLALIEYDATWQVEGVVSGKEALCHLAEGDAYDVVFLDYSLPGRDGLEVLEEIRRGEAPPPVVMVTGRGDEQVAVKAMKGGAYDYVVKGEGYLQRLPVVAQRAVEAHQLTVERKRAEKALREGEERLRTIVEASLDAIIAVNVEGRLVLFNGAAHELFQYSEEEALNQPADILLREEICEIHQERLERFLKKGVGRCGHIGRRMEKPFRRKDGSLFEAEVSMSGGRLNGLRLVVLAIHDITDRKQTEEALRQSEENFRHSLDESPLGVRIVTIEGKTIYANRAILDIYGYDSVEELTTTPVKNRYTLQSYAEFKIRREKRKEGVDGPSEYEISIVRKNGEIRHLQVFRKDILWNGERQFQVIYQDITERKLMEKALQESENRYRELFENMGSGVSVYETHNNGEDFIFKEYNAAAEMLDKTPRGQAIGRSVVDVFPRVKDFGLFDVFQRVYRTGKPERHPVTFYKDEKISGWRENYVYKLPSGKIVAVFEDITQRKWVEEALKESEERYRQLFENAPAGIYEIDLTTGRILSVNDVICKYTEYTKDELLTINALDLLTGESQKIFIERMAAYAAGKPVPSTLEFQARSKSGREFWMSLNAKYFYKAGVPVRAAVVAYDITKRKRVENELRASQQQLRAFAGRLQKIREEERVMIAREIHDEMGGGLTGLKMDLSWLLRKMGDADPCEERVALMDKIHTSNALIDRMIHVVRRISTDLRPSVLDDLGLIAALEWQLSEFTSRTEIQHEFIKTFDYVYLEEGTAVAVFRIFQEALTNIVRHSRATKVVVVLLEGERSFFGDESLVLEIRDNGRGITEEEILNKDSLGLLGMKERVLTFGGELSICGEPGGGTALILKIPRKKEEV